MKRKEKERVIVLLQPEVERAIEKCGHKVYRFTLKAARVNAGYSQEEAASILGISPDTLRTYEAGKHVPRWDVVDKMRELYQLPVDLMRFGVNEEQ